MEATFQCEKHFHGKNPPLMGNEKILEGSINMHRAFKKDRSYLFFWSRLLQTLVKRNVQTR